MRATSINYKLISRKYFPADFLYLGIYLNSVKEEIMINNFEEKPLSEKETEERFQLLHQIEDWLELPVVVLGFIWLVLLVIEFIWGLNPILEALGLGIWAIFFVEFIIRFIIAPEKLTFLRKSWLTILSLIIPALRVFRIFRVFQILRAARATQGIRLIRVFGTLNRGFNTLKRTAQKRGFIYIFTLTLIVLFVGAAGMYAFENNVHATGFKSYGDALWWTSMILTTLGSEAWPASLEGRILGFFIALYTFGIFGYVTAWLATVFVGKEVEEKEKETRKITLNELHKEITLLRQQIEKFGGES
jgi:voltage-gated potassium channel